MEHETDEVFVVGHRCPLCNWTMTAKPKPPTLREWLGDRVSELGRWAEVLREQPVPAGQLTSWEWFLSESLRPAVWMLRAAEKDGNQQVFGPRDMVDFVTRWDDFLGDC